MASFDNVAVSLFLSDARSEVLPIRLWTMIETNLDVRAAAASGVLVTTTIVAALVMERIVGAVLAFPLGGHHGQERESIRTRG